tara:strand:+ start:1875 stop:2192 length:318 start_codon:yes stop_codon:yes gene_type:complete
MSIRQTTTHEFYLDVMNVMYFEHDSSIYVDDADDNSLQIHGVKATDCIQMVRNILCCRDALDISELKEHEKNTLFEIYAVINSARERGELGAAGSSIKWNVTTEE